MEEKTSAEPSHETKRKQEPMPKRYVFGIVLLLLIIVMGMLAPDVLRYMARTPIGAPASSVWLSSAIQLGITNADGSGGGTNLTSVLKRSAGNAGTNFSLSVTGASVVNVSAQVSLVLTGVAPSIVGTNTAQTSGESAGVATSASFFEAYARLITLLLSMVSVLGLFFAYFVRKSLRETEEDLERRFESSMKSWQAGQKKIAAQVTADAREIHERLKTVKDLEAKLNEAMDAVERADRQDALTRPPTQVQVSRASETLDEQVAEASGAGQQAAHTTPPAEK